MLMLICQYLYIPPIKRLQYCNYVYGWCKKLYDVAISPTLYLPTEAIMSDAPTITIPVSQPVGETQDGEGTLALYAGYMLANPGTVWLRAIVDHDGLALYSTAPLPLHLTHVGIDPRARRKVAAKILASAGFGEKKALSHQIAERLVLQPEAYFYNQRIVLIALPAPSWKIASAEVPDPASARRDVERFRASLKRFPHLDFTEAIVTPFGTELYSPQLRVRGYLEFRSCVCGSGPELAAAAAEILALAGFGDQAKLTASLARNTKGLRLQKRLRRIP